MLVRLVDIKMGKLPGLDSGIITDHSRYYNSLPRRAMGNPSMQLIMAQNRNAKALLEAGILEIPPEPSPRPLKNELFRKN